MSNFAMSGITIPMSQWGRGPYNVARINSGGTAGRLLEPVDKDRHLTFFRTPVDPPEATDGAVSLSVQSVFAANTYFGPSAVAVAPDQDDSAQATITVTGTPTGGNFVVAFSANDLPATITYNSTAAAAKTALAGLDDGHLASEFTVTGGTLPGTPLVVSYPAVLGDLKRVSAALTGGTAPAVTIT